MAMTAEQAVHCCLLCAIACLALCVIAKHKTIRFIRSKNDLATKNVAEIKYRFLSDSSHSALLVNRFGKFIQSSNRIS